MRCIAHQDHFAGEFFDAGHLAEDAAGVEHRLADEHAVARALVDEHPFTECVDVEIQDVADDETVGDFGGIGAQRAQPDAFGLERFIALQTKIGEAQFRLEPGLVGTQGIAGGDALAKPIPPLEGTGDRNLYRIGDHRQNAADLPQMVVALVEDDETQRQQGVQDAA